MLSGVQLQHSPLLQQPPRATEPLREAGPGPDTHPGAGYGELEGEAPVDHPGYHTVDQARLRANWLAIMNQANLSAEMVLNHVKRLINYLYSFTKLLASPDPGADFKVVKMWRFSSSGAQVIAGGNVINTVIEILYFLKAFGNPVEGDKFVTPALSCIKLNPNLIRGEFLRGWAEDKIVQLAPEAIVDKLEDVHKSETWAILRRFITVLDNCGQMTARLPMSTIQPCYRFIGRGEEPRSICDAYNLGMSAPYNRKLNTLVKYVQHATTPCWV